MSVKKIVKFPSDQLTRECQTVDMNLMGFFGIEDHVNDLRETLAATSNGVALSSNQIPETFRTWRIFVTAPNLGLPPVAINPGWVPVGDEMIRQEEGCLSVPELIIVKERFKKVVLSFNDMTGARSDVTVEDLAARIVQHECDHLKGTTIFKYLNPAMRVRVMSNIIRNRKAGH